MSVGAGSVIKGIGEENDRWSEAARAKLQFPCHRNTAKSIAARSEFRSDEGCSDRAVEGGARPEARNRPVDGEAQGSAGRVCNCYSSGVR